jgi:hypothetical protein
MRQITDGVLFASDAADAVTGHVLLVTNGIRGAQPRPALIAARDIAGRRRVRRFYAGQLIARERRSRPSACSSSIVMPVARSPALPPSPVRARRSEWTASSIPTWRPSRPSAHPPPVLHRPQPAHAASHVRVVPAPRARVVACAVVARQPLEPPLGTPYDRWAPMAPGMCPSPTGCARRTWSRRPVPSFEGPAHGRWKRSRRWCRAGRDAPGGRPGASRPPPDLRRFR